MVGTNAMPAYYLEAAAMIHGIPDETINCDLAWTGEELEEDSQPIWDMLKAVDATFTVNTERSFQARNAKAYEVEILAAPSRIGNIYRTDRPMPVALPEQEWLVGGRYVDQVVTCRDGQPARIVAPDPPLVRTSETVDGQSIEAQRAQATKDRKQGLALLDAVRQAMPQYPLDETFEKGLPGDLAPRFHDWADQIV